LFVVPIHIHGLGSCNLMVEIDGTVSGILRFIVYKCSLYI
jgi:hypothetical protein